MNPIRSMLDRRPREMSNGWTKESEIIVVVEEFSNLSFGLKRAARIKSVSAEIPEFTINISRSGGGQLLFNLIFVNGGANLFSCKVLILGNTGFWNECGQVDVMKTCNVWCEFPLTVNLETRTYKQYFLQNDAITLKCKVTYFELTLPENSATIGHGLDSPQSLQTSPCVENLPLSEKKKEQQKSQSTLADDLISLYKEGTLCDTTLRTESETFPAHKTVLSARSPVFKKMFTSDMKERDSDCVDISDINADTLSRFLLFIYTDTLADIEWQSAMELYFAADKYQIDSLKLKCSTFLKSNVQPSNCCDLLLLSDMHQDADLKQFVQDYIIRRDQGIFGSDEWRNFMANHVQLAADTMYFKYARK